MPSGLHLYRQTIRILGTTCLIGSGAFSYCWWASHKPLLEKPGRVKPESDTSDFDTFSSDSIDYTIRTNGIF